MALRKGLYRGYSSFEFERVGTFKLNDVELIKIDLLNHIYTRKGERVNMPRFGTTIPDLVFEPIDEETLDTLERELRVVFEYDPRIELLDLQVIPEADFNSITAAAKIRLVEIGTVEDIFLNIEFESAA